MAYKAFWYALRDWWAELLVLSLANVVWLVLLLLVIPAPPATAAMFVLARGAMLRQYLTLPDLLAAMRQFFVRSWLLAIISWLGVLIGVVDLIFYGQVISGVLGTAGSILLLYMLAVWCQAQCYAWAQLVLRPDLSLWHIQRNGLILTARHPVFGLVLLGVLLVLTIVCVAVPPLFGLAVMALWALFCVEALARLVPELLDPEDQARLQALAEADAAPSVTQARRGPRWR
jgi:hypothetical protein